MQLSSPSEADLVRGVVAALDWTRTDGTLPYAMIPSYEPWYLSWWKP